MGRRRRAIITGDLQRIAFCGNDIWCVPTGQRGEEFDLELEVYTFQQDWTSTSDSVIVQQVANPVSGKWELLALRNL